MLPPRKHCFARLAPGALAAAAGLASWAPAQARAEAVGRATILERAAHYSQLQWTLTRPGCAGSCPCPSSWESDFDPGTHQGVPYKWGGWDNEEGFRAKLTKGHGAGSHKRDGVLACTTGQDCSGFVSRVWGTSRKHSTSTLSQITRPIAFDDLQPGDALNKKGAHVVLYAGQRSDGVPVFYEASGGAGRVHLNRSASWAYLSGFQAVRYLHVSDETPVCEGTADKPLIVENLPFRDRRSLFLACSRQLARYSCKPSADESGAEFIYQVSLDEPGTLHATVVDPLGVDVDLHVLSAIDESACLARGDKQVAVSLAPGTYFLVADTYTDSAQVERAGPFELSVSYRTGTASTGFTAPSEPLPPPPGPTEPQAPPEVAAPTNSAPDPGCGCTTARGKPAPGWLLSLLAWVAVRRRRG